MICARLLIYSKAAGLFIACCCPCCLCFDDNFFCYPSHVLEDNTDITDFLNDNIDITVSIH